MVELKVRWHRNESSGIMDLQFLEGNDWVYWQNSEFWKGKNMEVNGFYVFQQALKEGYEIVK